MSVKRAMKRKTVINEMKEIHGKRWKLYLDEYNHRMRSTKEKPVAEEVPIIDGEKLIDIIEKDKAIDVEATIVDDNNSSTTDGE